jgi:hypothetical protein
VIAKNLIKIFLPARALQFCKLTYLIIWMPPPIPNSYKKLFFPLFLPHFNLLIWAF